jgi:hypothetical protein
MDWNKNDIYIVGLLEVAPPGMAPVMKKLLPQEDTINPYAVAWSMKGNESSESEDKNDFLKKLIDYVSRMLKLGDGSQEAAQMAPGEPEKIAGDIQKRLDYYDQTQKIKDKGKPGIAKPVQPEA